MKPMKKQNILLIINPVSGRKKARTLVYQIVDSLSRNNCSTMVFTTAKKGEATNIVIEHTYECHKIICCGGDGTLNEIISGLAHEKMQIPIGFIPTGTTNDFAHALNLPISVNQAIKATVDGCIRQHDIGVLNENQYFSYVASFGTFTKVAYATPQRLKNFFGSVAYIFKGIFSLSDIQPQKVKIVTDGEEIAGDFVYGSVSNSTVIGGIIKFLETDVIFDDGLFEILLIKTPSSLEALMKTIKCILHKSYDNEYTYFFKASKVSFSFDKGTEWTTDGEYAGTLDTVHIKANPCTAQIITALSS